MTNKQTEKWLYRAWNASEEIDAKQTQLEEMRSRAMSVTATLTGMPGRASKDPHAKMEKYLLLSENISIQIDKLIGIQKEVTEVIDKVQDDRMRIVLTERYINRRKWEDISNIMHYSHEGGYVFRLNRLAIQAVKDVLETVH